MKYLLIFPLLLCFPSMVFAQQRELRGELLDAADLSSLPHGVIKVKGDTTLEAVTDDNGHFQLTIRKTDTILVFQSPGYKTEEKIIPAALSFVKVLMSADTAHPAIVTGTDYAVYRHERSLNGESIMTPVSVYRAETYDRVRENRFVSPAEDSVSMLALSTDRASYSNVRRFIDGKEPVPPEAVRIEEMVNYFPYHYPLPTGKALLAIDSRLTGCPWKTGDRLLRISVQARNIPQDDLPPANLVFLLDVSGSMSDQNKLPLLKLALRTLIPQLNARDRVSVVLYNDSARLALPPTPGDQSENILDMVNNLVADGTTAGEKGIQLAYKVAAENFIPGGVNRVILATDGDFNIGPSADEDMRKLILRKRQSGVYLTCIGFGKGNYKDSKLETLAKWGNGNFFYMDNPEEAHKLFDEEFEGTLFTLARDAVLQVNFDPAKVSAFRLIGYENRLFAGNDSAAIPMEGGQIGTGLGVTVFYEIVPQKNAVSTGEFGEVRLRFTSTEDTLQTEIDRPLSDRLQSFTSGDASFRFASAVALFGMLLEGSRFAGTGSYDRVMAIAKKAMDKKDKEPYRKEFLKLVKAVKKMNRLP